MLLGQNAFLWLLNQIKSKPQCHQNKSYITCHFHYRLSLYLVDLFKILYKNWPFRLLFKIVSIYDVNKLIHMQCKNISISEKKSVVSNGENKY